MLKFKCRHIILFNVLLVFIFTQVGYSQHLWVKTNVVNAIVARPSLDVDVQFLPQHSIALHASSGVTWFYKKTHKPYYRFRTITLDYLPHLKHSKSDVYTLRGLVYAGLIERKIYRDEVKVEPWYSLKNRKGRDFTGNAWRAGLGISNFFKAGKRISFEQQIGIGIGKYYKVRDEYYPVSEEPSRTFWIGYIDFRFALNVAVQLF